MDPGSLSPGPASPPHGTPQGVEPLTDTLPSLVIVHSFSEKLVPSQLLLQLELQALQSGVSLNALYLLLALKGLLCSFPWFQQVLQLQSSLLRRFGSATQDPLALKPPALLASDPHAFAEAALAIYRALRRAFPQGTTYPCVTTPREEDSTEMTLCSRPRPRMLREKLCCHSGVVAGVGSLSVNMDPGSLGSGPGSTPHGIDVERVESLTDTLPSPVIVHSFSLKLVLSHLLLQLEPQALQSGVSLKALYLLLDLKELLRSFPWVQVVEEKQEANTLLQSTAVHQVVQRVMDRLEQTLGPRCVLRGAFSSLLVHHHMLHLVALSTARLLPDEESPDQQRQNQVVAALPPQFTISSELVEVLLVQLVLTLPPVDGSGSQPLSPQDLLGLFVHMTAVTLGILNSTPGVTVDTCSPLPVGGTRRQVLQLQSSLLRRFESATQDLLALKAPALLASIPHAFAEAALAIYRSLHRAFPQGTTYPCVTTPREEDSTEMTLCSRPRPRMLREKLCHHSGDWVGNSTLLNRAFTESSVEDREEQEEDRKAHNICPLLEIPLVPEGSVEAIERMFGSFWVEGAVEIPRSTSRPGSYDCGPLLPPANQSSAHWSSSTGSMKLTGVYRVSCMIPLESMEPVSHKPAKVRRKKWYFRGLFGCCKGQSE
ncbi:unnamed protein product [Lota lota]